MFLPTKTKAQRKEERRYAKMLELHKKRMEEYQHVPWTEKFSNADIFLDSTPPLQAGAAATDTAEVVDKGDSDSDFDPDSIKYCKEWDPDGIIREYDELYYRYRKEGKSRRKKFVDEAFAKKLASLAAEEEAERKADAAAAADAAQSNRGAEIIAQYKMPKIPENFQLPLDESYVPFTPMVYTELPAEEQPQPEDSSNISILAEDEMGVDDVFGDDQIAVMERPARDLIVFKTPSPSSSEEILQEDEMMMDDIFGEGHMAEIDKLPIKSPREETIINEVINLVEGKLSKNKFCFCF